MRDLPGRVAVITGAGRGIGLALARAMAARHMRVVLSDVKAARPDRAAAQSCARREPMRQGWCATSATPPPSTRSPP